LSAAAAAAAAAAAQDLPEHCLRDVAAYGWLSWLGMAAVAAQLLAAYAGLTAWGYEAAAKDD
jgi:hypothetical protein